MAMTVSAPDLVAANRALASGTTFRAVRRARLVLPGRDAEFATRAALEEAKEELKRLENG